MLSACSGSLPGQWNRGSVLSGYLVWSRSELHTTLNQPGGVFVMVLFVMFFILLCIMFGVCIICVCWTVGTNSAIN